MAWPEHHLDIEGRVQAVVDYIRREIGLPEDVVMAVRARPKGDKLVLFFVWTEEEVCIAEGQGDHWLFRYPGSQRFIVTDFPGVVRELERLARARARLWREGARR